MDVWSLVDGRWLEGELAGAEGYWYNVTGAQNGGLDTLAERYGLHPLSIEDCRSAMLHAPKIDEFHDHIFVVLQAFVATARGPEPLEMDIFFGPKFLITYQDVPLTTIQHVLADLRNGVAVRPGVDGLFYTMADHTTDALLPLVSELSGRLDEIEVEILSRSNFSHQPEILSLRSRAGAVRRLLVPQLTVMQRLARGEIEIVDEQNRIYFRDVYDHLVRINLELEALREDSEVALTTLLSAVNNRLSEVMKVLSVVSALALPAIVIAGIFGTNFDNVPGLHSNLGFSVMIGTMIGMGIAMGYYFRRRRWF